MTKDETEKRIADLLKQRDQLMAEINFALGKIEGQIQLLREQAEAPAELDAAARPPHGPQPVAPQ